MAKTRFTLLLLATTGQNRYVCKVYRTNRAGPTKVKPHPGSRRVSHDLNLESDPAPQNLADSVVLFYLLGGDLRTAGCMISVAAV